MRRLLPLIVALLSAGCEIDIVNPTPVVQAAPPSGSSGSGGGITITNTNSNNSTNNNVRSDTAQIPATTPPAGSGTTNGVLPLPSYGEHVTRDIAGQNPSLLANSCQEHTGESAWQFLDLVIRTLRSQDQRWGYLCKDASCVVFARDIVAYRASSGDTGIWIVDVIGNHCPGPNTGDVATVRWGILPFELERRWAGSRVAGVFP